MLKTKKSASQKSASKKHASQKFLISSLILGMLISPILTLSMASPAHATDTGNIKIFGGYADSAGDHTLTGNNISISGPSISADGVLRIRGAYVLNHGGLLGTDNHTLIDNTVSISNSRLKGLDVNISGAHVLGSGNNTLSGNKTFVSNSHFFADKQNIVSATRALITIYGASIEGTGNNTLTNNTVTITGTTLMSANILITGAAIDGLSATSEKKIATGNKVFLSDVVMNTTDNISIYGAYFVGDGDTFTGNTVTLTGNISLNADTDIYLGGASWDARSLAAGADLRTGNTLIIDRTNLTITAKGTGNQNKGINIFNFEKYVFNPTYEQVLDGFILTANNINLGTDATLELGGIWGGNSLAKGTEFGLMKATGKVTDGSPISWGEGMTGSIANINDTFHLYQGIARYYDAKANLTTGAAGATGGKLTVEILSDVKAAEQGKVPAETRAASVVMLNQGADLLSGAGIENAQAVTGNADEDTPWLTFGVLGGGKSRYSTGSYADMNTFNFVAGIAKRTETIQDNELLYGSFFEYGFADINTHNSFATHSVDTDGNSSYYGIGAFVHFIYNENIYAEASLRTGLNVVDQSSTNYFGFVGRQVGYDTSSMYFGAHLGGGYLWEINNKSSLDMYGKYFWTHQSSDEASVAGDTFNFDAINSHRTRLGTRYSHVISEIEYAYIGLAWEHEFGGDAEYSVHNVTAGTPSLEGSTAIIEIGLVSMRSNVNSPFSFDIGLEGYLGTREGISGQAQLAYEF